MLKIGEVAKLLNCSSDTLRYYEKINLLQNVARNSGGIRLYAEKDLSSLKFIKRAQSMNFTLAEISKLLLMRADPQNAKLEIRQLALNKLELIDTQVANLTTLKNELTLLLNLCRNSEGGCPIIEGIDSE